MIVMSKTKDHYLGDEQIVPEEWDKWNQEYYESIPLSHGDFNNGYDDKTQESEMSLIAKDSGGGDFKIPPEGTHIAVCNMIVDVGMQETGYGSKHKIYIRWELPQERMEWDDNGAKKEGPLVTGNFYTLSLSQKANLRKDLEGWRGKAFTPEELKGFDILKVLGHACQLSIVHNTSDGKTYANVSGVVALPKGVQAPKAEIPLVKYTSDDIEQWDQVPEWLQMKINNQPDDFNQDHNSGVTGQFDDFDDDIPF